ncbi:MAG: M1 family metallopeptidase [Gemmatimonadota bacterium]|nr:M1 family metallopeptidase [Gemmatimonadota bacterium]
MSRPMAMSVRAMGAALIAIALGRPHSLAAQYPSGGRPAGYRPGIDVTDYDLSIDLPDTGATIEARAVLTVKRTARVDTLVLDLLDLRVDSVYVNRASVRFKRDAATISIPLPGGSGDELSVVVKYGGHPVDGLIIHADAARWTAFADNWPNRGRHWIPSVDHPSDKATVSWTVRAPSERKVIANGKLVEEAPLSAQMGARPRTITRWRESRPIPVYLMVIAVAPLDHLDLGPSACGRSDFGCVEQTVYVFPEDRAFLPGPFAESRAMVDWFSTIIGPFPYEKLSHLESSTRFGGMENASAIFYPEKAFRERTLDVGTVAHETAHQWFGDAVTEREWAHVWLSEGFATYFAALWTEHSRGDSAFRAERIDLRKTVVESDVVASRPVIDTTQTDYLKLLNANSYPKGGFVLHMLRRLVGDSAFFIGIADYYARRRDSTAMTDDLRRAVEARAHVDLAWFFDQWLKRPGFAQLSTSSSYDPKERRVILEIRQGQRFAPYRFPLLVDLTQTDGTVRRTTIQIQATATQRITLPFDLSAAPRSIRLDPDVDLLATIVGPQP